MSLNDGPLIVTVLQLFGPGSSQINSMNYTVFGCSSEESALGCPVNKASELSLVLASVKKQQPII